MKRLNVVVVGTGMYVCGRGTDGFGTIMPAINEYGRSEGIGKVSIAGRSRSGAIAAKKKIAALNKAMGVNADIEYYPARGDDPKSYIKAMKDMPKPACAIIAVPDDRHKEVASAAMRNGLHALVVKPLVPTVKEAKELVDLQRRNGLYGAVELHKRYDAANLKLKEAVLGGAIGDPLYFVVEFSQRKNIPEKIFRKWAARTNIFQYLGIHYVDMVYFVTGASPVRAMAVGQKRWLRLKGVDTYDAIEAFIEW
ncbi:MAG: Gfo/Idh/MocA family oxidoreductase, partial [Candidatus Omnitrophota bacterium]